MVVAEPPPHPASAAPTATVLNASAYHRRRGPGIMSRGSLIATATVACLMATPGGALGQDPPHVPAPDAIQQPLDDGCHRNPAGFLDFTEPEWVFVDSHE